MFSDDLRSNTDNDQKPMSHYDVEVMRIKKLLKSVTRLSLTALSIIFILVGLLVLTEWYLVPASIAFLIAALSSPRFTDWLSNKYGLQLKLKLKLKVLSGTLLLVVFIISLSASVGNAEKEKLTAQYQERKSALITVLKADAGSPDYQAAFDEATSLLSVSDWQFKADYEDAQAKLSEFKEVSAAKTAQEQQEKAKAAFLADRDTILATLKDYIEESKIEEAVSFYSGYQDFGDIELDKLGKKANDRQAELLKEQQLKAARAAADSRYIDPVRAYVTFLDQAEVDFKATKASDSDLDRVRKTLVLFTSLAEQLNNARSNKEAMTAEQIKYLKGIETRLSQFQARTLPGLRQAFAKNAGQMLWEHNAYVTVSGGGNRVINLTAGMFASNANIQKAQEQLIEILTKLRFSEARYRWYKGADEFTYYKVDTPTDARLAVFKFDRFEPLSP